MSFNPYFPVHNYPYGSQPEFAPSWLLGEYNRLVTFINETLETVVLPTASDITYNDGVAQLGETTVQGAIEKLKNLIDNIDVDVDASDVDFDDNVAQLGETTVQGAIVALKTLLDSIPTGGASPIVSIDDLTQGMTYNPPQSTSHPVTEAILKAFNDGDYFVITYNDCIYVLDYLKQQGTRLRVKFHCVNSSDAIDNIWITVNNYSTPETLTLFWYYGSVIKPVHYIDIGAITFPQTYSNSDIVDNWQISDVYNKIRNAYMQGDLFTLYMNGYNYTVQSALESGDDLEVYFTNTYNGNTTALRMTFYNWANFNAVTLTTATS